MMPSESALEQATHTHPEADQTLSYSLGRGFRVLMVAASPFPLPQGSQVLVAGLAESLQRRGHSVQIVAYPTGKPQPRLNVPIHRAAGVPFYRRLNPGPSFWKPFLDVLLARKVLSTVRRDAPDVLHTHNFEGLLVGLWVRRKTGVPVVYHLHNLMEPELPAYFRFGPMIWAGRELGRWVDHHLPRRADACIVLHAEAATRLEQQGIFPEQVHVIPPGIDLPDTPPPQPSEVRRHWGLGSGPLVLYSGNFDRYQDLDFLLRAFHYVRDKRPEVRLILVTHEGIERNRARGLSQRLGHHGQLLTVSGWTEMYALLASSDVAVSPRQECWGFPIKVLNYMAAGRPIVAASGSAQGLRHMETAWVVPKDDAPAFAQAILALLDRPELANQLGQAARQQAARLYNWPACAEAVEGVYQSIFGANSGSANINRTRRPT